MRFQMRVEIRWKAGDRKLMKESQGPMKEVQKKRDRSGKIKQDNLAVAGARNRKSKNYSGFLLNCLPTS